MAKLLLEPRVPSPGSRRIIARGLALCTVSKGHLKPLAPSRLHHAPADRVLVFSLRPKASQRAAVAALTEILRVLGDERRRRGGPTRYPSSTDLEVWGRHHYGRQSFGAIAGLKQSTTGLHGSKPGSRKVEAQRRYQRVLHFSREWPGLFGHMALSLVGRYMRPR